MLQVSRACDGCRGVPRFICQLASLFHLFSSCRLLATILLHNIVNMPTEPGLQAGTLVEHPKEATHPVNEKLSDKHHAEHERRMSAPLEADDSERELVEGQPTSDELHTLRRVSAPLTFSVYTVAFVELCERFSYYGTQVVCKCCCIDRDTVLIY